MSESGEMVATKRRQSLVVVVGLCLSTLLVDGAPHRTSKVTDCENSGNPADVFFLLDASNSIWRPDFNRQIAFIRELSRMFRIGSEHTQIGVITYAEYPQFQFHLNYYSTKSNILAAIESIRQTGGYHTSTPEALRAMRERGFSPSSGARANVTRVGIVITDGNSDEREKTVAEAEKAKDAGIHLFAVGVGMGLDLSELEAIASPPSKYYTFKVDSYDGLDNIKELLAIKACTVTDPPTTPATTTTVATTWTTTTTTEATVAPSTENPLYGRTPVLEGPRSTSGAEDDVHPVPERVEEVDEFQGSLRQKPETAFNEVNENDPDESGSSKQHRGTSDADDELNELNHSRKNNHKSSGQNGSGDEEGTLGGRDNSGSHPGETEVEGTLATPPGSDARESDNVTRDQIPEKGRKWTDSRQDGSWVRSRNGSMIWIDKPDVVPVNGTRIPFPESDADYQVYPGYRRKPKHDDNSRKPVDSELRKEGSTTGKNNGKPGETGINKHAHANRRTEMCRPKTPLDVVFIIDPKPRDHRQRRHLLETVRSSVEHIDMDNGRMRVQFVQSCTKTDHRLRHARTSFQRRNAIDPATAAAEATHPERSSTADLFQAMTEKLTAGGKPGRKRIGVYLTSGPSGDFERTLEAVQTAKNEHDVEMFAVGLGRDLNPVELRAISSCDVNKHMFTARNGSKTKELARHLTKALCSTVR